MINLNDLKPLLESSVLAFATSTPDGRPNCVAVSDVRILEEKIIIADNFFNKTRINLDQNPKVSLAFWSPDGKQGYQIKGTAQIFTQGKNKNFLDTIPEHNGYAKKAAIVVTVTEIWDLANPKLVFIDKTTSSHL